VSATRRALWCLAGALLLVPILAPPEAGRRSPWRLLGPFLELAAELQWVRFQQARLAGEEAHALELAEGALALDPRSSAGWVALAEHLALDLASAEREPDLARRRAWFQAGLEVLTRGGGEAEHPEELELARGLLYYGKASGDPELAPGGARELRDAAVRAFERAAELGAPTAREYARLLREED